MTRTLRSSLLLVIAAAACTPTIEKKEPPAVVTARFDPGQTPAVVPAPNDLAMNPLTGRLAIPVAADASAADKEFAAYLGTLDGFPASTAAKTVFDGEIDQASITKESVIVYDITDPTKPVPMADLEPIAVSQPSPAIVIAPPEGGWTPGHAYSVTMIGGPTGLKGTKGQPVVGSEIWALIRSEKSLVTCEKLTLDDGSINPECRTTTDVIPSDVIDPAERLADQSHKAAQLEQLRRGYKPMFDGMQANAPEGMNVRAAVVIAWTFRIASFAEMVFDPTGTPPAVPIPNDLAIDPTTGKVNAPIDPTAPAAEQEFTRDYLNTLDGFPTAAGAETGVRLGDLDPATVNADTVRVVDMTEMETPPAATIAYDAALKQITIEPPAGGWTKGHQYAVVVVGGAEGVKSAKKDKAGNPEPVVASNVWALARSRSTLVTCDDLADETCAPAITLAPLTAAQAVALEGLRRGYEQVLDGFEKYQHLDRLDVLVGWTFKIVSQPELVFDPSKSIIPFPNNILRNPVTGKINLPLPADAEQRALAEALNTLDGFSTTGPVVSENGLATGALDLGNIDDTTLESAVGFFALTPQAPAPEVEVCVSCLTTATDPTTIPEILQIVPKVPLVEKTTYGAYVSGALKNKDGKLAVASPAFALLRLANPLINASGKSQVSALDDAQAAGLEPLRAGMKPFIDALEAKGLKRSQLALAWAFTTQTTYSALPALHAVPATLGTAGLLKATPDYVLDGTATVLPALGALPKDKIDKIYVGEIPLANLLTGPGATMKPSAPAVERVPFLLVTPKATVPGGGFPVVVFQHGITGSRMHALPIANTLATGGFAVLAIDSKWHGERSTCVGAAALGLTPCAAGGVCDADSGKCKAGVDSTRAACDAATVGAVPANLYCMLRGQGTCLPDAKCQNSGFAVDATGRPEISGWNYINPANLFGTRDSFRQHVVDMAQLYRIVASTATGSLASQTVALDATKFNYLGMSLGGIQGSLYAAAAPEVKNLVLNVTGGDLTQMILTSPSLNRIKVAMDAGLEAKGIKPGTPPYDQFIATARWIVDPADPISIAPQLMDGAGPANRHALVQWITDDQTIPNPTTASLLASANRTGATQQVDAQQFDPTLAALPLKDRHGFLLNWAHPATTLDAQTKAVTYLATP